MSFYLEKVSKTYYFRMRVPKDLLPYLGIRRIRKSLKTKSYADAKSLVRGHLHITEKLFVAIRSNMLSPEQIAEIVEEWKTMYLTNMIQARRNAGHSTFLPTEIKSQLYDRKLSLSSKEVTEGVINSYMELKEKHNECILTNSFQGSMRQARGIYKKKCPDYEPTDSELNLFCESILMARIDICDIMIERMKGNYKNSFDIQLLDKKLPPTLSQSVPDAPSKKLSELWSTYTESKKAGERWTTKTQQKYEGAYNAIIDILGDINLCELENEQLQTNLQNSLKLYPKNKNKYTLFRGKPFNAKMAESSQFSQLSIESINFITGVMSGLVSFAVKNPKKWGLSVNLFSGQGLADKRVKSEKRDEYTREDIEGIFRGLATIRRIVEPERFWIPLICLYSGMRQNEACQLRVEDITEVDRIKIFQICHNPDKQQTTKTKENRNCPIHPTLEQIGFMEYVAQQKAKKAIMLFSNLRPYEGSWNKDFQKWYGRTFRSKYASREKTTFHSTRHSFINWFKQNTNIMETLPVLKSIVGHLESAELSALVISSGDITHALYGKEYDLKRKYDLLRKLDYKVDIKLLSK